MRHLITRGLSALALAGLVSCSDSSGGGPNGDAQFSLILKDAPGDVVAAVVTIDEIYLQGNGGKTVLSSTPVTTNLVTLAADAATLVDDVTIPAGSYSELRFVISDAYIEVDNGDGTTSIYASSPGYAGLPPGAVVDGNLQMPSLGTSGLKVTLPAGGLTVNSGTSKILVVDFDVSQSFGHVAGNSGQWVMHPVIHATDIKLTGSASVTLALDPSVTLPIINNVQITLGDFTATFTGSDNLPRTAAFVDPDLDGVFTADLLWVPPGDYALDIVPPAGINVFTTTPAEPTTITVAADGSASAAFIVTAASP
jgi:hypothetical protein